jgi:predicted AlkP superfamily phosphohydrolase/phosphomutase
LYRVRVCWVHAAIVCTLCALVGCGGGKKSKETSGQPDSLAEARATSFSSLADFLGLPEADRPTTSPVVFIGIDGASWEFMDPLIAGGELPNLQRVKAEGAYGRLRSIECYVSPPAWTTMMTGCLPSKTGVYTYGKWDAATHEFGNVNAEDVLVPQVWDVASYCGRKAGVFNVPMTFPPHPLGSGAMVTGMMTPYELGDPPHTRPLPRAERERLQPPDSVHSYSPIRRTGTTDSLNVYLWSLYDTVDDRIKRYDTVGLDVITRGAGQEGARRARYTFEVGHYSPWVGIREMRDGVVGDAWCKFGILRSPDGGYKTEISPTLGRIDAAYTYPDTLSNRLLRTFGYYAPSVFMGEKLVPALASDAVSYASYLYDLDDWDLYLFVFTQSDNIHHLAGFSEDAVEVYKTIDRFVGDVMDRMPPGGELIIASDHGFREYSYGVNLNQRLSELGLLHWGEGNQIDYDSTLVFQNLWHLYFNQKDLTHDTLLRHGIDVPRGADPSVVLFEYLEQRLARIESKDGSLEADMEFSRYPKGAADDPPDAAVRGASGDYVVDFLGFGNPHTDAIHRFQGSERWWHQRDGVFMVWGEGVRPGFDAGTRDIQDIAPTMLYLLGVPVSKKMDGSVIDDVFGPDFVSRRRLVSVDDYVGLPEVPVAKGKTSRESLEKKLRSLGYVQ